MSVSRRGFIGSALAGSVSLGVAGKIAAAQKSSPARDNKRAAKLPIMVCSEYSYNWLEEGYKLLSSGTDTLDAALKVIKGPEDDPNDESVGLGGHPNEEGVVELDACCMHGPTRTAGSVGGVRNIKNVSLLSNAVRRHTGHVMLVGEGAERFAVAQGFNAKTFLPKSHARNGCCGKKPILTGGARPGNPDWRQRFRSSNQADDRDLRLRRMEQVAAEIGIPG